jgi:hypothetical protein
MDSYKFSVFPKITTNVVAKAWEGEQRGQEKVTSSTRAHQSTGRGKEKKSQQAKNFSVDHYPISFILQISKF